MVNHNIGQSPLFSGNDFGNISSTVNLHYSQSENPRHFSQKNMFLFWLNNFNHFWCAISWGGIQTKTAKGREGVFYNLPYLFFFLMTNALLVYWSHDWSHCHGIFSTSKIPIESKFVYLNCLHFPLTFLFCFFFHIPLGPDF